MMRRKQPMIDRPRELLMLKRKEWRGRRKIVLPNTMCLRTVDPTQGKDPRVLDRRGREGIAENVQSCVCLCWWLRGKLAAAVETSVFNQFSEPYPEK
jgi:hypothetical protein